MMLKIKKLNFVAGRPIAILSEEVAKKLNVYVDERVIIKKRKKEISAVIDILSKKFFQRKGEIIVSESVIKELGLKLGEKVEVIPAKKPKSLHYIKEKMQGKKLTQRKIKEIIRDIKENNLTESEIAYYASSIFFRELSNREIIFLIKAIVETGKKLNIKKKYILDKHCIGGIAGNRTTPLVVSLIASAIDELKINALMPKTSSRAITSASGTADTVEVLTKVEFSINELKKILEKIRACIVWNGILELAPADDKIIEVERLVSLESFSQLIASIISKKISVGATHVVIDIPYGKSAKVSKRQALNLKRKFKEILRKFKIKSKIVLTDGSQPIGNGIGPVLEMRDIVSVLIRNPERPLDLEKKSLMLASELLTLVNKKSMRENMKFLENLLDSGKVFQKFMEILETQSGKKLNFQDIEKKLVPAKYHYSFRAKRNGKIKEIDNKKINELARITGCPVSKKSGVYLWKHKNQKTKRGEKILTIFSESKFKLREAKKFYKTVKPILFE